MKDSKQCPKCQSLRIGYLSSQPDVEQAIRKAGEQVQQVHLMGYRPLGVRKDQVNTGFLNHGNVNVFVGQLEAYVCTACGYHETYVAEPQTIPWNDLRGFRWVNEEPDGDKPYR